MQNHYNLIYREEEREMNPLCVSRGIALIPWSPLARGFLAGNRSKSGDGETTRSNSDDYAKQLYYQDDDFQVADRLQQVAQERGVPRMQVALAWLLGKPGVTAPIIGASKMHHLDEAIQALTLTLTDEESKRLEEPYKPHRILGHS
jgi:1-deoxyxylulose-5-phosphate synthase